MNVDNPRLKRMQWHSRRGMLELDLLLAPYAANCLQIMSDADLADYEALLLEEDQDLFLWFTGRAEAPEPHLARQVERILAFSATTDAGGQAL